MAEAAAIDPGAEEEYVERIDPILRAPELYQAARDNITETVLELLREEVPPFYFDKKSNLTALHWASIHGNAKVVKKLLEAGAHQKYLNQKQRIELESRGGLDAVSMDERAAMEEMLELEREHIDVDYFKNTPLLWAASKGHLEVVWQLLKYGYSPNDVDNLGNTALHVAAASGYKKIVQTLVDDGAMPTVVNHYKNPPLHLAKGKEIAELLEWAVEKGASMTQEDIKFKHEETMRKLRKMEANLSAIIQEAGKIESPRAAKSFAGTNISDLIQRLSSTLKVSEEWSIDTDTVVYGKKLLVKLETSLELLSDLSLLQKHMPIKTQAQYLEYAQKLESTLDNSETIGVERAHVQLARDLLMKCQAELHLCLCIGRLVDVTCAVDANEHDMKRLKMAAQKAEAIHCSDSVIDEANLLFRRLEVELKMTRALNSIPVVKLPPLPVRSKENPEGIVPEVPAGYWQECDVGHLVENEGFPRPPAEINGNPNTTGEYIWESSESLTKLRRSILQMKDCMLAAQGDTGANETLVHQVKDHLIKAEKDAKALDAKDASDKAVAVEAATKAAKKLKGGKKK